MLKNMKLAPKLILIGGSLVLIPLLIVGITAVFQSEKSLRVSMNEQLKARSQIMASLIDAVLEEEKKLVQSFSLSTEVTSAVSFNTDLQTAEQSEAGYTPLTTHLKKIHHTKGLGDKTQVVALVDPTGLVVAASDNAYNGVSIADRRYFKDAIAGKLNIGGVGENKVTQQLFLPIAAPVFNSDNKISGVIIHIIDISFINEIVETERLGNTGYGYVTDASSLVIAHPYKDNILKTRMSELSGTQSLIASFNSGNPGLVNYNFEGDTKTAAHAPIKATGWTMVFTISDAEFLLPINTLRNLIIGIVVAALIVSFVGYLLFSLSIARNIQKGVRFAHQIARGDLKATIEIDQNDEIGSLAKALQAMANDLGSAIADISQVMNAVKNGDFSKQVSVKLEGDFVSLKESINDSIEMLSKTIIQVVTNAEQVSAGSGDLAGSAQALASGTTEQAASLEEIASSMAEIDAKTKGNDENTFHAKQLITETQEAAKNGTQQMKALLLSISGIKETSTNVAKIIKEIDEIAFQTNLLALNAAVEAARAGKYGKGFAVVAEEVRNLAARSAEAARSTADLINDSVQGVERGVEKADQTDAALTNINESIAKVNDIIEEISASSQEQRSGIEEINKGLAQVNEVIQGNSSISEETASASEELAQQADNLQQMMSAFKLSEDTDVSINHSSNDKHLYRNNASLLLS